MEVTPRTLSRRRVLPSEIIGLNAVVEISLWELFRSISDTLILCEFYNPKDFSFFSMKIL